MHTPSEISSMTDRISKTQIEADDEADSIIIGIDFGTTYSGVAYCLTSKPSEVHLIKEWPGAKGRTWEKCPTLVKYAENGSVSWGYELDRTTEGLIEGIKLYLDPEQPKPIYVPAVDTRAELERLGKAPVAVASDFLGAIYKHASAKIESKYPKDYFNLLKKQYVLTVPAVWSDKAQDATLRAARNAGITSVKLVKEPEAAALFTLHHMGDKGLKVGDAFVICDAGGGTVDLISYEIVSLKPFELKELVAATGGLAGSLMLNRRFEDHVKTTVGEKEFVKFRETGAYALGMKQFDEIVKPGFHTSDVDEQYINFPKAGLKDRPLFGLSKDTITVKKVQLYEIFEPIIFDIDRLVSDQITQVRLRRLSDQHPKGKEIAAIFLVGGFGASAYLHAKITAKHPEIRVIQPNDAWSAIVRGAVMYNLPSEATVVSNVAPKHYGVDATMYSIDPILEKGEKQLYNSHTGKWGVNRMTWYIEKGDDLQRARPIEFEYFRSYDENPSDDELQVEDRLWECDREVAPRHPKEGLLKLNCTLKTDLSVVPKHFFEKRSRRDSDGKMIKWWELHYKLVVTIQSGPMLFSLKCRGKEYAAVAADY